jgi:N-acetyl-gamma-glutamylphosphate reductase
MQTLKRLFLPGILLALFISGCTFTTSRTNRDEDKKDAEKVINKFYDLIKSKKYDATHDLFSSKFWEVTSVKKMDTIFTATQNKLGDLVTIHLDDWATKVVAGTDPSADYRLIYKNHHQKSNAIESFTLTKEDDGKIRIISYNINSDGFFK